MTKRPIVLSLALFAIVFWNFSCQCLTGVPFSGGGGTETGNPGMLACVNAIFEEISNTSRQSPQTYLPRGEWQLNPGSIWIAGARGNLAHTCVADTDTVDINKLSPNTNVMKYVTSIDTIISVSWLTIKDTILIDSLKIDTTHSFDSSSKDFAVIIKRRINYTVFINYSVGTRDTILTPHKDSMFIKLSDSANAKTQIIESVVPGTMHIIENTPSINTDPVVVDSMLSDHIVIRIPLKSAVIKKFGIGVAIPNSGYTIQSGYTQLFRESRPLGSKINEAYECGDENRYLYSLNAPLSMMSKYTATYSQERDTTDLSVVFDAGRDSCFPTTADNRIVSLERRISSGGRFFETIVYAAAAADSSRDTARLTRSQYPPSGLVTDATTTYFSLPGNDPLDHRQNRIGKITQKFTLSDKIIRTLEIKITFDAPTTLLQQFSDATVIADMSYAMAKVGTFEGRLDMKNGTLYGKYTENGVVYPCYYERGIDMLFWGDDSKR